MTNIIKKIKLLFLKQENSFISCFLLAISATTVAGTCIWDAQINVTGSGDTLLLINID